MRVLHINNTSHIGGAARAMRRLHTALVEQGHESRFLVGRTIDKQDPLISVIWDEVSSFRSLSKSLQSRIGNKLEKYIGIHPWANRPNLYLSETDLYNWAEIIDLRNLFGGFFNLWCLPSLSRDKPVVWRLPDLWALTGHCAYPYDCQRWKTGCYDCPLLTKEGRNLVEPNPTILDGTRRVWRSKRDIYQRSKIHIIVTTRWMEKQVRSSILKDSLSINVISNGVNLDVFQPTPKEAAREKLGLDPSARYLVWAAGGKGNRRKGYQLALDALISMQTRGEDPPWLLTMGSDSGWDKPDQLLKIKHFGFLEDGEDQALVYSAADGFLCTTLADGQPQTVLESMACGTPVIAFDLGPMPEMVKDDKTGWIVKEPTSDALRLKISEIYQDLSGNKGLIENCRKTAEKDFDLSKQTNLYVKLYEQILSGKSGSGNYH